MIKRTNTPATSSDHILPSTLPTQLLGDHVIEAQVVRRKVLEAVLALVAIAEEQVAARESRSGAVVIDELLQGDDTRQLDLHVRAADRPVVIRSDHRDLFHEHSLDDILPSPQAVNVQAFIRQRTIRK